MHVAHIFLECIYTEWSEWSHCSKPCDNGKRERTREVIGADVTCDMLTYESETCNTECCPSKYNEHIEYFFRCIQCMCLYTFHLFLLLLIQYKMKQNLLTTYNCRDGMSLRNYISFNICVYCEMNTITMVLMHFDGIYLYHKNVLEIG